MSIPNTILSRQNPPTLLLVSQPRSHVQRSFHGTAEAKTLGWVYPKGVGVSSETSSRKLLCVGMHSGNPLGVQRASYGVISVIGRQRVMEDVVAVNEVDGNKFFAVYDGHGGVEVADACRERMHQLIAEELGEGWNGGGMGVGFWERVMRDCFERMDEEVPVEGEALDGEQMRFVEKSVGTSAVVVLVGKEEVVVANCGDSRVVLCRDGAPIPLSRDHRPDMPYERERLEAACGRGSRHILKVLATSRSIGDIYLKPYVIAEPEVTVSERHASDEFLVMASDGLWDVVSNEAACEVVKRCFDARALLEDEDRIAAEAAVALAVLAISRGSKDNVSVIVIEL